jgi:hypothetical protein
MEHTKTPWRVGRKGGAVVADEPVPEMGGSDDVEYYGGHMVAESLVPRNTAFIVRACNAHEQLVEALTMIRDADNDAERDGLQRIPAPARATIDAALTAAGAK